MNKKCLLLLLAAASFCIPLDGHPDWRSHFEDIYSVLPFEKSKTISNEWIGLISSDLIDNYHGNPCPEFGGVNFELFVQEKFNFSCSVGDHRILFHWPFNAKPWTSELDFYIRKYSWSSNADSLYMFKQALIIEQARRNRKAMSATERIFGIDRASSNALASFVYDVHLLGDWLPQDNHHFNGVTKPRDIVLDIISSINRIDSKTGLRLVKKLRYVSNTPTIDNGVLACKIITLLQEELPLFIIEAQNGALMRIMKQKGIRFKFENKNEMQKYYANNPGIFKYRT